VQPTHSTQNQNFKANPHSRDGADTAPLRFIARKILPPRSKFFLAANSAYYVYAEIHSQIYPQKFSTMGKQTFKRYFRKFHAF